MRRLMAVGMVLASASLWLVGAQSAHAATFVCNEIGPPNQGMSNDVPGNVQIPADGQCNTYGYDVGGNILVGKRAKLFVWDKTIIKGSIIGDAPKQLNVADGSELKGSLIINGPSQPTTANPLTFGGFACGVKIGGSVTLQNLNAGRWVIGDAGDDPSALDFSSSSPELNCDTSDTIAGSVNLINNKGVQTLEVSGNTISGSVTINSNTVVNETIHVEDNTIGGALGCSGNTWTGGSPAVSNDGEPNTVKTTSGQCTGF